MQALKETNFHFAKQTGFYRGKVRDVYYFQDKLAVVATDRISAFDVVLPRAIPFKGQVLNQIAATFLKATSDIVPNWVLSHPDPNVTIGINCEPFKVEMVIRGYLAGHAWREYQSGKRAICGASLPEGLRENDKLPEPIITPTTKAAEGHDEDISPEDIIATGIVSEEDYRQLENYTRQLFTRGTEMAAQQGLLLVDTKYEFGKVDEKIYLIDEVHTPDSSRYFYADGYTERQKDGQTQKQLSKEFVRKWLIENDFQGKANQRVPEMDDDWIQSISERYIELFEVVTGTPFQKTDYNQALARIEASILQNV
ncbi:phosphoribosylaminoimidazolesuccinocarboxamide synthase [Adhaeribacter radiodurans]|uniref:Phosphoribosylaminoimidazole-succinocarboxamide synthase n=1 Tax=Adhaeribacter radiodurans TaxID=2745197 RepID=A0A7L7LFK2_9BACT|nr:phosphoribosylaminoimidazolesuccinocarboxamide synthase [Adhaeribacter radiodurans]QMU31457.1 phosphoribosylaminoimidazolesuccinocarboxamide synthase [Adhaeribacter radiodurans]